MKVVIVTGASRGLGRAVVARLLARGAGVVAVVRRAEDAAALTAEFSSGAGAALTTVVVDDVAAPGAAAAAVAAAVGAYGRLDAVVNNAGVLEPLAHVADVDAAGWRALLDVNVVAPALFAQAALPELRARDGVIVNVSSGAAVNAYQGWGPYCCSKAAVNMLTAVLAKEEPRVRSIAVRPGAVATDMQATVREKGADAMTPEQYLQFVRLHENGSLLAPALPADAIAVLALACPADWSGAFVTWNDERVAGLVLSTPVEKP